MSTRMIALIGEQPIPNLLPILYDGPSDVLLVRTDRTAGVGERLRQFLNGKAAVYGCDVEPYDVSGIVRALRDQVDRLGWPPAELVFNLTGGTKTMALAAYQLALERSCPFIYLESERGQSRLRQYAFEHGLAVLKRDEIMPGLITIDDYLRVHLDGFSLGDFNNPFEQAIYEALRPEVDEIIQAVQHPRGAWDIDLVVRLGNQVGIIEAKTGGKGRKRGGIDQLNTAGGRAYLGIYTRKFLVVDSSWERQTNLAELAQARYINVVELPGYQETQQVTGQDRQRLIDTIKQNLGGS